MFGCSVCLLLGWVVTNRVWGGAGALLWALLAELPPLLDQGVMAPVRDYVDAEGPSERSLRLTTLCQRLARVFQAYGTYRADLVHAWQAPTSDEPWEAPLWRAVEARVGAVHVVGWSDRLGAAPTLPEGLGRLALFGVSTLPPLLLDVAARLAGDHDIHVFLLHPSPRLWSRPGAQHPLLDSMGELIRDVQHAVGACDGVEHDVIDSTPGPRDSLLHALQADLGGDLLEPPGTGVHGRLCWTHHHLRIPMRNKHSCLIRRRSSHCRRKCSCTSHRL